MAKHKEQDQRVIPLRPSPVSADEHAETTQSPSRFDRIISAIIKLWMRLSAYYLHAVREKRIALVPSAMSKKMALWVRLLFLGTLRRNLPTEKEIAHIRELAQKGSLVYVMYCRSVLDYLFVNQLFAKAGLPLAGFANGIDLIFCMPLRQVFHTVMARLFHRRKRVKRAEHGGPKDEVQLMTYFERELNLESFEQVVREKKPVLIFLKRSRSIFSPEFGFTQDYLLSLTRLQRNLETPIFLMPQLLIWDKKPVRLQERSVFEVVFGDPDAPGYIRKIVHFLRYYRRAYLKFGEAINLSDFLKSQDRERNPQEEARRIRYSLRHFLYREKKVMIGPRERSRQKVIARICRHKDLEPAIQKYCARTGRSVEEGRALAYKYADELVADRRWGVVVFFYHMLHFVFRTFYNGVVVDPAQLERLRQGIKDHPVVFVSNHRSHIDYLVLCWIFYRYNVLVPYICAGVNLNFWPLGPIFRRSGAFFIRRSYPEPDLYPMVLARYIRELLAAGQGQLFFIEGGRSRTGKMLRPKMGILAKVMEAFQDGVTKDVSFAPAYVGYDRILEEKAYLAEAAGGEKAQEDLSGLLRFARKIIRARYGKIYVSLDEPISLKKYLEENPEPQVLEKFASRLCYGINRVTVVFPTALAAMILLSHRKRALSNLEIYERAVPLLRYLERRKVRLSDVFYNREYAYESALKLLRDARLVHALQEDQVSFYSVDESKRILLNYYKNNILHFFVTYSLLSTCLLNEDRKAGEGRKIRMASIERYYDFLLALLDGEFYFRPKEARPAHVQDVFEFFKKEGALELKPDSIKITADGRKFLKQQREIVYNFLESYALMMLALKSVRGRVIDEKDFIRQVISLGRKLYVQGRIERLEALHRFTLESAFVSLARKGFMRRESDGAKSGIKKEGAKSLWRVTSEEAPFELWLNPLTELVRQNFAQDPQIN